jgi:hypothetical protein
VTAGRLSLEGLVASANEGGIRGGRDLRRVFVGLKSLWDDALTESGDGDASASRVGGVRDGPGALVIEPRSVGVDVFGLLDEELSEEREGTLVSHLLAEREVDIILRDRSKISNHRKESGEESGEVNCHLVSPSDHDNTIIDREGNVGIGGSPVGDTPRVIISTTW